MFNPFSLENKNILVTGASSGLGVGIAIDCSKMGANMVVTARNEERLNRTMRELEKANNFSIIADLVKDEDIEDLVEKVPVLDGVVLCAGVIKTMPVKNIKFDAIDEIFDINIISSIKLLKLLLKNLKSASNLNGNLNCSKELEHYAS